MTADSVFITFRTLREALPETERERLDQLVNREAQSSRQRPKRKPKTNGLEVWDYAECYEHLMATYFAKRRKLPNTNDTRGK